MPRSASRPPSQFEETAPVNLPSIFNHTFLSHLIVPIWHEDTCVFVQLPLVLRCLSQVRVKTRHFESLAILEFSGDPHVGLLSVARRMVGYLGMTRLLAHHRIEIV